MTLLLCQRQPYTQTASFPVLQSSLAPAAKPSAATKSTPAKPTKNNNNNNNSKPPTAAPTAATTTTTTPTPTSSTTSASGASSCASSQGSAPTSERVGYIDLPDSVLYVEGGGQPGDVGTILDSRGVKFRCTRVEKLPSGAGVRHTVVIPPRTVSSSNSAEKPASADGGVNAAAAASTVTSSAPASSTCGDNEVAALPAVGEDVSVSVDWARRYDYMQQHTAQHLFSHLAMKHKNLKTVGWALHDTFTSVELEAAEISDEDLLFLQDLENAAIRQHVPVNVQIVSHDQLNSISGLRSRGSIPTEGDIRIIQIEGYDTSTCGGTHIANTAELQTFRILLSDTEHSRKNVVRIFFLAGQRELKFASIGYERDKALSRILSCPADVFTQRSETLLAENIQLIRQRKKLLEQVARYEAQELSTRVTAALATSPHPFLLYTRDAGNMESLQEVEAAVREKCGPEFLLLSVSSDAESGTGPGVFILSGPLDLVKKATAPVMAALGGKGGGKSNRIQGRAMLCENGAQALENAKAALL
ncbi:alanyl-tRNA editing protein Aarsd1 [Pelomyxa schiedti]|nr:alanyl-tRNA editing protein Aarsd1 [Pelomyxa schiedti]